MSAGLLGAEVRALRAAIEGGDDVQPPAEESPTLAALGRLFGLTRFERALVALCAGVEIDAELAAACARRSGSEGGAAATFGLALATLPDAHWSALSPDGPLRRWGLVEPQPERPLTTAPLRIDERVLHYLAAVDYLDAKLEPYVRELEAPGALPASQARVAELAAAELRTARTECRWPLVALCGEEGSAKLEVAAAACLAAGLRPARLSADVLPTDPIDAVTLRRLWEREATLGARALIVDAEELAGAEPGRRAALIAFLDGLEAVAFVTAPDPPPGLDRVVRLDVPAAAPAERRLLWQAALGEHAAELNGRLDAIVQQFALDGPALRAASDAARCSSCGDGGDLGTLLWDACRVRSRPQLDGLGQRIDPAADWAQLVLPADRLEALHQLAAQVRRRSVVYDDWGFGERGSRGLGISALFAGPSGTGKTMAAEVIARELRLDLYRIDLSAVVSKYIGETEKNLRRVFDAAERGGAVLLFDEADALFGKRTEVQDSHDRFANIEVSYLLQRMEAYAGLAILTTNMRSALDDAFVRRLRFVVEFPFPDAPQRAEIWRRVFPDGVPLAELDFDALARMDIAGGNIRNVALGAAFLAADAEEPVGPAHLVAAARTEYAKLDRPLGAGMEPVPA